MNPIERLIMEFEDMCGESDTELGNKARQYYQNLLYLLERAYPFVDDMQGIGSGARPLMSEIDAILDRK